MGKYTIGVDFGTLSGRAVLVDVSDGSELAGAVFDYPHGVMDETLPDGTKLGMDWALQHPQDYLDVFGSAIPAVIKKSGVSPNDVIGIGIDFTACTLMPTDKNGEPMCFKDQYKSNPHAYIKLWKHHAAQNEANRLNDTAAKRGESFLSRYGGKISSEWMVPKVMQIVNEAPEIYDACDRILEAADWCIWQLTGVETRNSCTAGYKALWSKRDGYPSDDFYAALDPKLKNFVGEKLSRVVLPIGGKAGVLTEEAARLTGLLPGTAVAAANVDAHVSAPAVGITRPGQLLMIMGTSTCHIMLGDEVKIVPGMCGVVEDGVMPGFAGYEAGQSCVGDHFEWFTENCVPEDYRREAAKKNMDIHQFLTGKASGLEPGQSGLVALDWWNGNRSVLVDADLTGLLVGCTLQTKPEEIYRALIEATAYGTRMIIDTFAESGVPVDELFACGGIAEKNALMMQIYADVTGREIRISGSPQAPALGSAMFGAVAAGSAAGGYDTIYMAVGPMSKIKDTVYRPNKKNTAVYDLLYAEYKILHDYFGRGANDVMKRLKKIKLGKIC
ncbi:MAG: ribulokinase [Defluviitaleaceae bacterium]|nr:ribulokinase [Defluviitaleaceae bacterium]